jgi:hypothetical protein
VKLTTTKPLKRGGTEETGVGKIARKAKIAQDRRNLKILSSASSFPLRFKGVFLGIPSSVFPNSSSVVHITFGVIPESATTPLVTFQAKSRTVCINTTITCGATTFVSQDFDVLSAKIWY